MKKILIFIFFAFSYQEASGQPPELGWSRQQLAEFIEGKYKYKSVDTIEGHFIEDFAPVSLYGIDWSLSVGYSDENKIEYVDWQRGGLRNSTDGGWSDKAMWTLLNSKIMPSQVSLLVDSISQIRGKALITRGKGDKKNFTAAEKKRQKTKPFSAYNWKEKNKDYLLMVDPHGNVDYLYTIKDVTSSRK